MADNKTNDVPFADETDGGEQAEAKKKRSVKAREAKEADQAAAKELEERRKQEEKDAKKAEKDRKKAAKSANRQKVGIGVCVACAIVGIVVGVLMGTTVFSSGVSLNGATTLTESELDTVIATYTYNGKTYSITAEELILESSTLEDAVNDDGTYDVPASDDVLSYARNEIVVKAAEDAGITVTDDEVAEYTEEMFGTSDYSEIASTYSIDEDVAKETLTDSAIMSKLRDSVCSTTLPDLPDAPDEADDEDEATSEYAEYVIALLGDEWDSENDTWATTDGTYYSTLSSYEISNDAATYAAAYAAYTVAYSEYYTAYTTLSSEWTEYVNSLLSDATIQMGSLLV